MDQKKEGLNSLSLVSGVNLEIILKNFNGGLIEDLSENLKVKEIHKINKILRVFFSEYGKLMHGTGYKSFLGKLKKIRTLLTTGGKSEFILPSEGKVNQLYKNLKKKYFPDYSPWNSKKYALIITYDIDTGEGYRFLNEILKLNTTYGVIGTYNFLTHQDYKLNNNMVDMLVMSGNEVGLHGAYHDIALGYKSEKYIEDFIDKALDEFPVSNPGFRSPALSVSEKLLKILKSKKLAYDSSLQICSPFYHSVGCNFPYRYPDIGIWEFPLTIQDDTLFRDYTMESAEALDVLKRIINDVKSFGGMCLVNFHPHIISKEWDFYRGFLDYVKDDCEVWITTPKKIIDFLAASQTA